MNRTFKVLTLFAFLMLLMSMGLCQEEEEKKASSSMFKSTEYVNNKIGLSVQAPPGWDLYPLAQVQSKIQSIQKSEIKRLKTRLKELENKKNSAEYKKLKQALDNLEESAKDIQKLKSTTGDHNLSLFQALKTVDNSQVFIKCRAINADMMPQVKTGKDYLSIYLRSYSLNGSNPTLKKKNIGGKVFDYIEVMSSKKGSSHAGKSGKGMKDSYRIYCAVINKYILVMTCSFPRGEETRLDEFLRGMSFK